MDFGYCGGEGAEPCLTFAQGLGSFLLVMLMCFGTVLGLFIVARLLWLVFHFPQYPTKNELADKLAVDDWFIITLAEKVAIEQRRQDNLAKTQPPKTT